MMILIKYPKPTRLSEIKCNRWTPYYSSHLNITGSVPAVLKNALDVGSRPYGASVWDNKPAEIVSVSPGAISGFGANHHLRQSLVFLNMPTVQQPEAYIGNVMNLLDDNGQVANPDTIAFFQVIVDAFVTLINRYID